MSIDNNLKKLIAPICETFGFLTYETLTTYATKVWNKNPEIKHEEVLKDKFIQHVIKKEIINIADEERFKRISKIANSDWSTALIYLKHFKSQNNDHCFQLALALTERDPLELLNSLYRFEMLNSEQYFQILTILVEKVPEAAIKKSYEFIRKLDPIQVLQIWKSLAEQVPKATVEGSYKFEGLDPDHRFQIWEILAEKVPEVTIKNYYLFIKKLDVTHSFQIWQILSEKVPEKVIEKSYEFKNLDPIHSFQLWQILAEKAPEKVIKKADALKKLDPDHKFQIWKILAEKAPKKVIKKADALKKLDPNHSFQILKILAEKAPEDLIKNFSILFSMRKSEQLSIEQIFEVSEMLPLESFAETKPELIVPHFDLFNLSPVGIDNSERCSQLVKILAKNASLLVITNFHQFRDLNSEQHALMLNILNLELIAEKHPVELVRNFEIIKIANKTEALKIIDIIVHKLYGNFPFGLSSHCFLDICGDLIPELKPVFEDLRKIGVSSAGSAIIYMGLISEHPEIQPRLTRLIRAFSKNKILAEEQFFVVRRSLSEHILSNQWETWKNNPLPPKLDLAFFLGDLTLSKLQNTSRNEWSKSLKSASHLFNDRTHKTQLMSFLLSLQRNEKFLRENKETLLQQIFFNPIKKQRTEPGSKKIASKKKEEKQKFAIAKKNNDDEYINRLVLSTALIDLGKASELAIHNSPISLDPLKALFKSVPKDFFGSDYTEHVEESFFKITDSLRAGNAIFTYLGVLNQLNFERFLSGFEYNKSAALETFKQCCLALIENRFSEWRNDTEHLNKIRDNGFDDLVNNYLCDKNEPLMLDSQKHEGWTLSCTGDFSDLMLLGKETGGCLRINGGENRTHILGYISDGKIRALAIKNEKGEQIARFLIRLLWDEANKRPLLLLDKFYSLHGDPLPLKKALLKFAKNKAKELNLYLVSNKKYIQSKNLYKGSLESFSTKGPFEYVDTLDNAGHGVYSIPENTCAILYDPTQELPVENESVDLESSAQHILENHP
ncbi:MAG: hypothetical protein V4494_01720 [Chlamydiota bacterium]